MIKWDNPFKVFTINAWHMVSPQRMSATPNNNKFQAKESFPDSGSLRNTQSTHTLVKDSQSGLLAL